MKTILVAITDPVLAPDALHVAAASGNTVIDGADPRQLTRYLSRSDVVFAGEDTLDAIRKIGTDAEVLLLYADPGPAEPEEVPPGMRTFVLPAQAKELLGHLHGSQATYGQSHMAGSAVIGVTSAVGGAGASVFGAALARTVGGVLVDAVRDSGGADLLLGIEDAPGPRWHDIDFSRGSIDPQQLRQALPSDERGVAVLTHTRATVATDPVPARDIAAALQCLRGGEHTTIVDAEKDNRALLLCDHVIVVGVPEVRAMAAAAATVARFRADGVNCSMVLRKRGWSGLSVAECADLAACDVVGDYASTAGLGKQLELGGLPKKLPRGLRKAVVAALVAAGVVQP